MLTLMIPTVASRGELFRRCLCHLQEIHYFGPIIVSDHSVESEQLVVASIIGEFSALNIKLIIHSQSLHFVERLLDCAEQAATPYIMLHADDDFFFPDAAVDCLLHLEKNPQMPAARGRMVFFDLSQGNRFNLSTHDGRQRCEEDNSTRVIKHLENFFATLYAVHRRESFIDAYTKTMQFTKNVIFWQYLASCLTVNLGPVVTLDSLHYARFNNAQGWRAQLINNRDTEHWPYLYLNPQFSTYFGEFMQGIKTHCGFSASNEEAFENAFLALLKRSMGVRVAEGTDPGDLQIMQRIQTENSPDYRKMAHIQKLFAHSFDTVAASL